MDFGGLRQIVDLMPSGYGGWLSRPLASAVRGWVNMPPGPPRRGNILRRAWQSMQRTDLYVAPEEFSEVKSHGAKCDNETKSWYIDCRAVTEQFRQVTPVCGRCRITRRHGIQHHL